MKCRRQVKSHFSLSDLINDASEKKNVTIVEGESTVISCPITSVPEATYTWYFNNIELNFDAGLKPKDIRWDWVSRKWLSRLSTVNHASPTYRFYLLSNGSLLIVNSRMSDSGKYRCNATNLFTKKVFRNFFSMLNVVSRSDNNDNHGGGLLPKLQSSIQKIKSGRSLILHCASHTNRVRKRQW